MEKKLTESEIESQIESDLSEDELWNDDLDEQEKEDDENYERVDKISELKEKLAKGSGYNIVSFEKGFDAAMELNNSFQLWLIDARNGRFADNTVLYFYEKGFPYLKNYHWLFNYWLENIYQPE